LKALAPQLMSNAESRKHGATEQPYCIWVHSYLSCTYVDHVDSNENFITLLIRTSLATCVTSSVSAWTIRRRVEDR